jgi:ribosomal protein L11 methyltransferase
LDKKSLDLHQELEKIIETVGPQNIWRPVYSPDGRLIARGIGEARDGLPSNMPGIDFQGKSVVDLGCNFGYYTFLVKRAGARKAVGLDKNIRVIRGCEILKTLYGIPNVHFYAADITRFRPAGRFDMGIMIDLVGKTTVHSGAFKDFLDALERSSQAEMLLTLRPRYHVVKNLHGDFKGLRKIYPRGYIRGNFFYALDFARDRFRSDWRIRRTAGHSDPEGDYKETLHFVRR